MSLLGQDNAIENVLNVINTKYGNLKIHVENELKSFDGISEYINKGLYLESYTWKTKYKTISLSVYRLKSQKYVDRIYFCLVNNKLAKEWQEKSSSNDDFNDDLKKYKLILLNIYSN